MRLYPPLMEGLDGLSFFKMMGSGAGEGFSIWPDWSTYIHLSVWINESSYLQWRSSEGFQEFLKRSDGFKSLALEAYMTKGEWNQKQPFAVKQEVQPMPLMAVLTRASIKKRKLISFWKNVPKVSKVISKQESMLLQKGIGEWPLIEQATISVWDQEKAMRDFAYRQEEHKHVVRETRRLDWYKEEQFTRFQVKSWEGYWPTNFFDKLEEFKSLYE